MCEEALSPSNCMDCQHRTSGRCALNPDRTSQAWQQRWCMLVTGVEDGGMDGWHRHKTRKLQRSRPQGSWTARPTLYWPESSPQGERRFREGSRTSGICRCVNNAPESYTLRCERSQLAEAEKYDPLVSRTVAEASEDRMK